MLVNALFSFLIFRSGADILNPEEKGTVVVALYVGAALGLTATNIALFGASRGDLALCAATLWFLIFNLLWIPADAIPQLYFSVTILLPIIFLLLLSRCEPALFVALRWRSLVFGAPLLCGLLLIFIFHERGQEGDLLANFNEQPFHVVAQTIAKFSILFVNQWIGFPLIALALLITLNVRSALLGFLLAFVMKKYGSLWSSRAFVLTLLAAAVCAIIAWSNPAMTDAFLQRVLYRDRDSSELDTFNMTSGRDEIWLYYIQMLERSSLLELLFGHGAIWIYGSFHLEAHNDLLNLMVCYGLAGTAAVICAWYVILSRLAPEYRGPCVTLFLVLFFTNGVVFHQSNLLFLLFMAGYPRQRELYTILDDGMIGQPRLPMRG